MEFKPLIIGVDWELQINDNDDFRVFSRIRDKGIIFSAEQRLKIFKMDRDEFLEFMGDDLGELSEDDRESLLWIHYRLCSEIYDEIYPENQRLQ
jgi:hypothetical protein